MTTTRDSHPPFATTEEIVKLHGDPVWEAIWSVVKTWDINTPRYTGYCSGTGDHTTEIFRAIRSAAQAGGVPAGQGNVDEVLRTIDTWQTWSRTWSGSAWISCDVTEDVRDIDHRGTLYSDLCRLGNELVWLRNEVALLSASPPPPATDHAGWQDISTAPKDGTYVDIWGVNPAGRRFPGVRWTDWPPVGAVEGFTWRNWQGVPVVDHADAVATRWMPLPAAPETETKR